MTNEREGTRVPNVTLFTAGEEGSRAIDSDEIFSGRTVVVFALPGAYTPTCSSTHLPRYEQLAGELRRRGVDEIVCTSVNDPFVMQAWADAQNLEHVRVLSDGNGELAARMNLLVDKSDLGFGQRSWRYSMLVRDGVIEKMFVEPKRPGDPFEVSDADTMLRYLDPEAVLPEPVTLFSRPGCPHCTRAKRALRAQKLPFEEIVLGRDVTTSSLLAVTGRATTPQVFIGGRHIGGADDLEAHLGLSNPERSAA